MDEKQKDQAGKQTQPGSGMENKTAGAPKEHNEVEKSWESDKETEDPNMNPG